MDYIRGLEGVELEHLFARILSRAGAERSEVTQRVGDGGVDVIAIVRPGPMGRLAALDNLLVGGPKTYVLAQCKRRAESVVAVEDIREFVGAVAILRTRGIESSTIRGAQLAWELGLRAFSATALVYVTAGDFNRGAERLAEALDIVLLDGEGLSQAVLDSELLPTEKHIMSPTDLVPISELIRPRAAAPSRT